MEGPSTSNESRSAGEVSEMVRTKREETGDEVVEPDTPSNLGRSRELPSTSASSPSPKTWTCNKPGCHKTYKQYNGLKYHQAKG